MTNIDQDLCDAIEHGDTSAVVRLVEHNDQVPGHVLLNAVRHKRADQIGLLAPKCDRVAISQAFRYTTFDKNLDTLQALLPYTDDEIRNKALVNACSIQNTHVVEFLYPLCEIDAVLSMMENFTSWFMDVWRATFRERLNSNRGLAVGNAPPLQNGDKPGKCVDLHFITPQIMDDVRSGRVAGVQRFLDSNPLPSDIQKMIEVAATNNRIPCLKMLLSRSELTHDQALIRAAGEGHAECVQLLIPVSNPCARNSMALSSAVVSGNQRCVDLLLPVSDPNEALDTLKNTYRNPHLYAFLEHAIARRQQRILEDSLGEIPHPHGARKI